jgi:hypothetical protein
MQSKTKTPKQPKPKQGHKLVWFTLIILLIPCVIVGYVLLVSKGEQGQPVEGSRFSSADLNPEITESQMNTILSQLKSIDGVEDASINLLSATLRVHLNTTDDLDREGVFNVLAIAKNVVQDNLPFETYFTNTDNSKMYDIEIDAYNWIVDDSHPSDSQIYFKLTKTGAGDQVVDEISDAKNWDLVNSIVR